MINNSQILHKDNIEQFATSLVKILKENNINIITMKGDLGTGKTTITRALLKIISNNSIAAVSPTYNLVHSYNVNEFGQINHLDLYRINHTNELIELGFEELLQNELTIIEWPDIAERQLQNKKAIRITLENYSENEKMINYIV